MIENNNKENILNRIKEIDLELESLKQQQSEISAKWTIEKSYIQEIRKYKEDIERIKADAEKFEREGNLGKVAELRYGVLHNLEKKLSETNDKFVKLQQENKLLKEEVTSDDIAEVVAKWTGIPVNKMLESEKSKLLNMEDLIHSRMINQEDAVTAVSNSIRRSRAGLQDENKPIGSFIFLGSTGVGKTELAKALAEFLFDDESAMVRIDMSEYMDKFSISRLIGAPPGYVGYEEGGQLTEAIRRRPYSVILLDEIEKAHSDVFNILLQLLDDGRLTDSKGRTVNFSNTIVIMTSNIGSHLLQDLINENKPKYNLDEILNIDKFDVDQPKTQQINEEKFNKAKLEIINLLKKQLRPEFLNRIDEIVLFKPLTSQDIFKITELLLKKITDKLLKNNIKLSFDKSAVEWLSNLGFDSNYGARPLKRTIQKYISDELAKKILSGEIINGNSLNVTSDNLGKFYFKKLS